MSEKKRAPAVVIPEIAGQVYGQLTAISRVDGKWWMFKCTCGQRKRLDAKRVMSGILATCGDRRMHNPRTKKAKDVEREYDDDPIGLHSMVEGNRRDDQT